MAESNINTIKFLIKHGNNLIILTLSLVGFLYDGYQQSDLYFIISIILWIWRPEFDKIEIKCICNVNKKKHNRT